MFLIKQQKVAHYWGVLPMFKCALWNFRGTCFGIKEHDLTWFCTFITTVLAAPGFWDIIQVCCLQLTPVSLYLSLSDNLVLKLSDLQHQRLWLKPLLLGHIYHLNVRNAGKHAAMFSSRPGRKQKLSLHISLNQASTQKTIVGQYCQC